MTQEEGATTPDFDSLNHSDYFTPLASQSINKEGDDVRERRGHDTYFAQSASNSSSSPSQTAQGDHAFVVSRCIEHRLEIEEEYLSRNKLTNCRFT